MQTAKYKIKDGDGIIIGNFQSKTDRDSALDKYVGYGFPVNNENRKN